MAKRYIDTDLFKKKNFRIIPAEYKLFWIYLLTDCNHAGIWEVDMEVANLRVGHTVTEKEILKYFEKKIHVFDGGDKWFIPAFIEYQYGELHENNRVHKSVLDILNKYSLDPSKGLGRVLEEAKDKDKDKDMDKDKDKDMCVYENVKMKESDMVKLIEKCGSEPKAKKWVEKHRERD